MVYDMLYGVDDALHPRPQMAAGHVIEDDGKTWKITLRDGLRFHDGQKVLARDAVASLKRWSKRDVYAISVFGQVDELSAISDTILQFRLKRPFRLLADLLGKPNPFAPVVMPERLALTEPGQQVTEIIGSGPYKFVMQRARARLARRLSAQRRLCAAHRRSADWYRRPEDRVVSTGWNGTPSRTHRHRRRRAADRRDGLVGAGDARICCRCCGRSPDVTVDVIDTLGYHAVLRFNHLYPPFDNADIRRALLGAFSQTDMMTRWPATTTRCGRRPSAISSRTRRCASDAGMEELNSPRDLAQVKRELAAAGYNGEKFVFLVPTDLPAINAMSEVAADMFRKLGMNMDYQTLDWATVAQRLNSQEPLDKGGWSLNANYAPGYAAMQPGGARLPARPGPQVAVRLAGHAEGRGTTQRMDRRNRSGKSRSDCAGRSSSRRFGTCRISRWARSFSPRPIGSDLTGMLKGSVPMFTNVRRT